MNLRQCITRTVKYTKVTVIGDNEEKKYVVYGETTPLKELKKHYSNCKNNYPLIECEVVTEKRAIELDLFLEHSEIIEEKKGE